MSGPAYLNLWQRGELAHRARRARERLARCDLCPRACGVNRLTGEQGYCRAGEQAKVASHNVHMWEEPPISGWGGSGTIFFSHCTARCLFCQNYPISQLGAGRAVSADELAEMMLSLQQKGCHNINLVTPTHYVAQILQSLDIAAGLGLAVPLVYNTSGYESLETLVLLDGVVDIYLPDSKYSSDAVAQELSGFRGYVSANRRALVEMARQVGNGIRTDEDGIARRGMILRHLVLPQGLSQTNKVLAWVADTLGRDTFVSLMSQYFPAHRATDHPALSRRVLWDEYAEALQSLERNGLENGWTQPYSESEVG